MKFTRILTLALCASLFLGSCDDDDDDNIQVPAVVENSFSQQFPTASNVSWENDTQYATPYLKAEFWVDGVEAEAWYTADGTWVKTEKDFNGTLPQAVDAYIASHYPGFRIDDKEIVETPTQTFYKIELEQGKHEVELSITQEGEVLFISDNQATVPADVLKSFEEKYPNTTVKSWEREGNLLKAEFYNGNVETEVWFNYNGDWIKTETDFLGTLPQTVTDYINTNYSGYKIDEVNWVETPAKNYYEVELEQGNTDIELNIQEDGTVISAIQK